MTVGLTIALFVALLISERQLAGHAFDIRGPEIVFSIICVGCRLKITKSKKRRFRINRKPTVLRIVREEKNLS